MTKNLLNINYKILTIVLSLIILASCGSIKSTSKVKAVDNDIAEKQEMEFSFYFIDGNKYKTLGYFPEAKTAFSKCLEIKPNSAAVNYELANIELYQENYLDALSYAKKSAKVDEDNIWYQLLYANLLIKTGERKKGYKLYNRLIDDYPKDKQLMLDLVGYYSADKKNYSKAIDLLNRIESRFGVSEELFIQKEAIYSKLGQQEKIVEELEKLIEAYPDNINYLGIYAEYLLNIGEKEKAFNTYQKLFKLDPDNALAHISVGKYYLNIGDKQKAMSEFVEGISNSQLDIKPKVDLIISLSKYYKKYLSDEEIYSLVNLICETHPDEPNGHALKVDYLINRKRYAEARNELLIILKTDKENYLVWKQLLIADAELIDYTAMYDDSKNAIDYFPNYPNFFLYNGFACEKLKKYNEGIEILEAGLDIIIDQPKLKIQFLSSLAEMYYKTKEYQKAFKSFDKVLELDPDNISVLNNYSYYLSLRNEKLEKAVEMAKKAVSIEENDTYLDTYAWALYKNEKFKEALVIIEKAIAKGGDKSAVIVEHYGDILYRNNKKEDAMIQWENALKLGADTDKLKEKVKSGNLVD